MRNASCQQGENERDREPKKNRTGTQATFFVTTYDISFIKRELGSFTL